MNIGIFNIFEESEEVDILNDDVFLEVEICVFGLVIVSDLGSLTELLELVALIDLIPVVGYSIAFKFFVEFCELLSAGSASLLLLLVSTLIF